MICSNQCCRHKKKILAPTTFTMVVVARCPPPESQPFQPPGRGRNGHPTNRRNTAATPRPAPAAAVQPVPRAPAPLPAPPTRPTMQTQRVPAQIEITEMREVRLRRPEVTPPKKDFGVGFNGFAVGKDEKLQSYKDLVNGSLRLDLFRKLKFLDKEDLEFSTDPNSVCAYVSKHGHYHPNTWSDHWTTLKKYVDQMISTARSNATSAMRIGFRGK